MVGQCGIRMYESEKKRIVEVLSKNPDAVEAYRQLSSEPKAVTSENGELLSGFGLATIVKDQDTILSVKGDAVRSTILSELEEQAQ